MAKKSKSRRSKKGTQRSSISDPKRDYSLLSPLSRIDDRILQVGDYWRAKMREYGSLIHPHRRIIAGLGYGIRKARKRRREIVRDNRLRDRRDDRARRPEDRVAALRDFRRDRICKRRLARRVALFAAGHAGAGRSIRTFRRWTRDSNVRCK